MDSPRKICRPVRASLDCLLAEGKSVPVRGVLTLKMLLLFLYTCILAAFWIAAMPMADSDSKKADEILEYAIQYAQDGSYPPELTKKKKRADSEHAALLIIDKGEVFFNRGKMKAPLPSHLDSSLSWFCNKCL